MIVQLCTFFTGCTPFAKTSHSDCQSISTLCVSDGVHCVEIWECGSYVTEISCQNNKNNCYWDTKNCRDADTCEKLSTSLKTDVECRNLISTCTTTGSGCIMSGINCSDQLKEIQCRWNVNKTTQCYWNGSQCLDKICENAPQLHDDISCANFSPDGLCVAQKNGGCFTPTTCAAQQTASTCLINKNGEACYWIDSQVCVDHKCENAIQRGFNLSMSHSCPTFQYFRSSEISQFYSDFFHLS